MFFKKEKFMKKNYSEPELKVTQISNNDILMFSFEISFDAFSDVFGGEEEDV